MPTVSAELQKAIDNLRIRDVYSKSNQSDCLNGFDPKYSDELNELTVQQMHVVKQSSIVEVEDDGQLLRVNIVFGTRWVKDIEGIELDVKAFVEASFVAEYQITKVLEQKSVDEFALKNASIHVWPYWREFLASQCDRMRLPKAMLPIMQLAHHK